MKHTEPKSKGQSARDDRLKAALRANLQRRKAQARARDAGADDGAGSDGGQEEKES